MNEVPDLHGSRLRLTGVTSADRPRLAAMFREPASSRYLGADFTDVGQLTTMHERRAHYEGRAGSGHWLATDGSGATVGLFHLRDSWELPGGPLEIGWYLDPAHTGRGYATEAVHLLLDYGFLELAATEIWALVHIDNRTSQRVAERTHFTKMGIEAHYGAQHSEYRAKPRTHIH